MNIVNNRLRTHVPALVDYLLSPFVGKHQSVVVTGFWRSGTTWLQQITAEALKSKRVFEPFYPRICRYHEVANLSQRHLGELENAWMPFFGQAGLAQCESCREYVGDCLSGRVTYKHSSGIDGYWLRSSRYTQWESFRLRTVVKFVRAQLMLPGLVSEFGVPVLHLRRDPRAVLASFKQRGWDGWFCGPQGVEALLLQGADGRKQYFSEWQEEIKETDRRGTPISQAAAYWALTEAYVDSVVADEENVRIVYYGKLCKHRGSYLKAALDDLEIHSHHKVSDKVFERPSMTARGDNRTTETRRAKRWEKVLSGSQVDAIERSIDQFDYDL